MSEQLPLSSIHPLAPEFLSATALFAAPIDVENSVGRLPELWNVLRGDMSLVGPRPLLMEYLPLYSKEQYRRHEVRPGITGWAQCHGRNAISWGQKFELDVWYVDHISLKTDLSIVWTTAKKVLRRADISSATSATMEAFDGHN